MSWAGWLNTLWMLKCSGEARAFHRATGRVAETQAAVLAEIVARNRDTEFGRAHGFRHIRDERAYRHQVPLSCYEDYAPAIERIAAGRPGVLTCERVELLEPTSGTTGGEKLIPYTASLRRQFQRAVAVWIADLFRQRPALRQGTAYWSISPALDGPRHTSGRIRIGFDDDAAYLGALERFALERLLVVPSAVARLGDLDAWRYCTLFGLLAAEDLTLVSVWSPTFLTALFAPLEEWHDRLCLDLSHGTPRPPTPLSADLGRQLRRRPMPHRAAALAAIFRSRLSPAEKLQRIWPRLGLISCWADAAGARCVDEVRELFPAVEVQPKGLLATEGCVSFPLLGRPAPVLAVRSHFFEFQERDGGPDDCRLAHELEQGGQYRVILSTGGGLYRYQLRDEVEVLGFENDTPLLRFLGKADRVSDLVGEKLAEPHVRGVLDQLFRRHGLAPRFALLVPVEGRPSCYRLYLQVADSCAGLALRDDLEAGLAENPYYRHAVRIGQLAPVEVCVLAPNGASGWQVYERHSLARGQRVGNIKPIALDAWTGWPKQFEPLVQVPLSAQRS